MNNETAIEVARKDGFNSGLNWPDAWMNDGKPGGPRVPNLGYRNDPKWIAVYEQTAAENKAWCAGWEAGLAEKISTGRINPFRGTEKNAQHHYGLELIGEYK
jgi:hypothetical protein